MKKETDIRESYFMHRMDSANPIIVYGTLDYITTLMSIDQELGYDGDYQLYSYLSLLEVWSNKELSKVIIPRELEVLLEKESKKFEY